MRSFLFLLSCILSACTTQQLSYKGFENIQITDTKTDPKVHMDIQLYNPNVIGVKIKEMKLNVKIENKSMGNVQMDESVRIKRKSDFTIPVTCETTYAQIGDILKSAAGTFFSGKEIPVELNGTITLKKFIFFKKTYAFNLQEKLNAKEFLN